MCYSALIRRFAAKDLLGIPVKIRDQIDDYKKASDTDPKRFPPLRERIFPAAYGPVIHRDESGGFVSELMRYGAYPPHNIKDPGAYSTFNARRDNLESPFWSVGFMRHHGFVVLEAFYEWVEVKDLLKAGVVTLDSVRTEFQRQADERKARIIEAGKKYKPTPTEQKDARMRKIVIEFRPDDGRLLFVPVIFSTSKVEDRFGGGQDLGFAMITDEPTPEIRNAGHDRSPVILEKEQIQIWLDPKNLNAGKFTEMLQNEKRVTFSHMLAEAA